MTKSELIMTVMTVEGVLNTEVVEAIEPGNVTINVMVPRSFSTEDADDVRTNVTTQLEKRRPAGVEYRVLVRREGESFPSAMDRFAAVAAEITTHIAPLKKPPPPVVEKPRATVLFEAVIEIVSGQPSPCPRCSCQAFTLDENGKQMACRGCPLPSPLYSAEYKDSTRLVSRDYKCSGCGARSAVTMQLTEINLYCWGCQRLCIHSMQWQTLANPNAVAVDTETKAKRVGAIYGMVDPDTKLKLKPGSYANELLGVPVPVEDPSREPDRGARVLKGSKAVFTFQGVEVGTVENVEYTESEFDADDIVDAAALYKDVPPGEGYSISMTLTAEDGKNWADVIDSLNQRVAGEYGMTLEQLTASPAAGLVGMFYEKLGLQPAALFEQVRRSENIMREGKDLPPDGSARERRTGRTTKGLVQAIAQYATSNKNLQFLCVVGVSERYTKDLWRLAESMLRKINLSREIRIKPLFPNDFDPQYDYEATQRCQVYVDHSWRERNIR